MSELKNDTCDECGKSEDAIGWFAQAYRKIEIRRGRPDPGNLCGSCAGHVTGTRIGHEIAEKEKAS